MESSINTAFILAGGLGISGIKVRSSQGDADYFANDFKDVLRIINGKI